MRIVLTGSAGYTGKGIAQVLAQKHQVRGLDVKPSSPHLTDFVTGDISQLDTCMQALQGAEVVVLCHMAPNPDGYRTPELAVDVNVKGTANLYHAMAALGIQRAILVSTMGVLCPPPAPAAIPGQGPYHYGPTPMSSLYTLTKMMQELTACHYHQAAGIVTTMLRPGWIVYDGDCVTKYGQALDSYHSNLGDPRDIAAAIDAAINLPDPTIEAFTLAQDDSPCDLSATHQRLGWRPQYRFDKLRALSAAQ